MKRFTVERITEGTKQYYLLRDGEDASIALLPTKFLMFKTRAKASPNTVKMLALSLKHYMNYLDEKAITIQEVLSLSYDRQFLHFTDFLDHLSLGRATGRHIKNVTCNHYLKTVFAWLCFLESSKAVKPGLKVLRTRTMSRANAVGVRTYVPYQSFPGYLKEEHTKGRSMEKEKIPVLLNACTNIRDTLLLLLLAETGFRIGELLGVRYASDLDLTRRTIRVSYREDNENLVRAKNAEIRKASISEETMEILSLYIASYRDLLKDQDYLFVTLTGKAKGTPLKPLAVYAMLKKLTKKTGIEVTPHMLRHYYANERRKMGWDLLLISQALGHRHLSTTEQYLDVEDGELSSASAAYFEKYGGMIDPTDLL